MTTTPISPDCEQIKHAACDGAAWDHEADRPADCRCDCHATELTGKRAPTEPARRRPRSIAHRATIRPNDVEIDGIPMPWLIANNVSLEAPLDDGSGLKLIHLSVYVDGDVILEGDRA